MNLAIYVLGTEILRVSTDPPPDPGEGYGAEVNRHSGQFELGFTGAEPEARVRRD